MIDAHFKKEQFQFYERHGNASSVELVGCEKGSICHLKENKLRQSQLIAQSIPSFFHPSGICQQVSSSHGEAFAIKDLSGSEACCLV